jgi:hypothetical protein
LGKALIREAADSNVRTPRIGLRFPIDARPASRAKIDFSLPTRIPRELEAVELTFRKDYLLIFESRYDIENGSCSSLAVGAITRDHDDRVSLDCN